MNQESGNLTIVVEACTNLTAGTVYSSDPDGPHHPNRFYRLSMPEERGIRLQT